MIRKTRQDHNYRITIEELGQDEIKTLQFDFQDREDMFKVVEMINKGSELPKEEATRVGIALRLLGPVMMNNRKHALFADFMPHFKSFMQNLKSTVKNAVSA